MNELALFAGGGGGILGAHLLGIRTICAVECDPGARRVLCARQDDGTLPPFPIWTDVQTFDGKPWAGAVDIVSGGFPCQDIAKPGKGAGIEGSRSGLWSHFARIVREVGPRFVVVENSPVLTSRGLGRVLGDLASLGFDARWGVLGAEHAGAPHLRERIWILGEAVAYADHHGRLHRPFRFVPASRWSPQVRQPRSGCPDRGACQWASQSGVRRVAHGVARRVDRLRSLGNGQVPAVVPLAWRHLT